MPTVSLTLPSSAVWCCAIHPTLDLLFTGGRDAAVRVWDIRSKAQVHVLTGHKNTVGTHTPSALPIFFFLTHPRVDV